ncbi:MAG: DUF4037 domain-containing protein [Lachnospiraceae bacterium]|nr:DUF4037 domain-containing protein [Lachnospiraceae bacterium]
MPGARYLEESRQLYKDYIRPMIKDKYTAYAGRIAAGLTGEGSECFGFDDGISRDHDLAPGLCLWLSEETFAEIGADLQKDYEEQVNAFTDALPYEERIAAKKAFSGMARRRGVFEIFSFYEGILHFELKRQAPYLTEADKLSINEAFLAAAVNGEVFADEEGLFTDIRKSLASYGGREFELRLKGALHDFSQSGQYNYARMMARGELTAARICIYRACESMMRLAYILSRRRAPFYKWMRRGIDELDRVKELSPISDKLIQASPDPEAWKTFDYRSGQINTADKAVQLIEEAAMLILNELREQGITDGKDTFLDIYAR